MLKVFLVEDEVVVREGLCKNIKWSELGLSLVGEAADGELAYPMIQETRPDILITDIKMPFMDGLELSHLVKNEMPWVKIIIISGHDDFSYAKEAIGIGVTEYLLKPVNGSQITQVVLRVKEEIEREQEQQAHLARFQQEMREYEALARKAFFRDLVGSRLSVSDLLEKGQRLGLGLSASSYNLILYQLSRDTDPEQYIEEVIRLEGELEARFLEEPQVILFNRDLEGFALLIKGTGQWSAEEETERCLAILRDTVGSHGELQFFAAVGTTVQRMAELAAAFEKVRQAFVYRYLLQDAQVVYAHQLEELWGQKPTATLDLSSLGASRVDRRSLELFLKCGAKDEAAQFIGDYFAALDSSDMDALHQYSAMDAAMAVMDFVEGLGCDKEAFAKRCAGFGTISDALLSVESVRQYLTQLSTEALTLRDETSTRKYSVLLETAQAYIGQNYFRDDISLNQVAASVNISPSHFSTIFSQETGSTFIEYLTNLRMDKARELLRCSGKKTHEISGAVGYRDPHYFSYLFKKRVGCTPKEFRAGKSQYSD